MALGLQQTPLAFCEETMAWGQTSTQLLRGGFAWWLEIRYPNSLGNLIADGIWIPPLFSLNFWDCHNAERLGGTEILFDFQSHTKGCFICFMSLPSFLLPSLSSFLLSTLISFLPVLCLRFFKEYQTRLELWTVLSPVHRVANKQNMFR